MAAAALPSLAEDKKPATTAKEAAKLLPKRKLGKTGVEVSILNQGTVAQPSERHLNMMYAEGIRYIDTASSYSGGGSERAIAEWFGKTGYRKEFFLVTKDKPTTPQQWIEMVDRRLEALKTDYIDLLFIHNLGGRRYGGEASLAWLKEKEWSAVADKIRKSGKVKFLGFSTHCNIGLRTASLKAAADGTWVDVIMPALDLPLIREDKEFNKALDACHKAGVGLISMKECKDVGNVETVVPGFEAKGLNPFTATLTAVWSDERIASICSAMDNVKKLRENADAARKFKPLKEKELAAVHEMLRGIPRTYCSACDGRCRHAAGTQADLNAIARYVSYVEEGGQLHRARELFATLPPEARDWSGADLAAATKACKCHVDYARVMAVAEKMLA
jgi:predicted aldo/keto reductase-like oxidoreductase